jgi:hypothetical protein
MKETKSAKLYLETHEKVTRLAKLYGLTMLDFMAAIVDTREDTFRGWMSADEFERYLNEDVSVAEFRRIRARFKAQAEAGNGDAAVPAGAHIEALKPLLDTTVVPLLKKKELSR